MCVCVCACVCVCVCACVCTCVCTGVYVVQFVKKVSGTSPVCVCVCVHLCTCEIRIRTQSHCKRCKPSLCVRMCVYLCVCVCVCVYAMKMEHRLFTLQWRCVHSCTCTLCENSVRNKNNSLCMCVCVCMCVWHGRVCVCKCTVGGRHHSLVPTLP